MTHSSMSDRGLFAALSTSFVLVFVLTARPLFAAPNDQAPPLPAPTGTVVHVSTVAQLQSAVSAGGSNRTIVIAPGTYTLTSTLYLAGVSDVTLRGATDDRDDVVLVGKGLNNANYGNVRFGIWANGPRITIANLTVRDTYSHPIILNPGANSVRVYNVRLVDTGDQFIKANPDGSGGGVNNGVVEYSVMEYTTTARTDYTNGVDVHTGSGWVVRNNLFRNIISPSSILAGPAVLIWNSSRNAIVEGNTFINCQREISMGLIEKTPDDSSGGIIRNNFIYRRSGLRGDAAILVADSPNTQVLHNSILVNGTYPTPIEYRFAGTTGTAIKNNLLDGQIQARNGATGVVANNYLSAVPSMFMNPAAGDLHLVAGATPVFNAAPFLVNAPRDWDEDARSQTSAVDYGADEYGAGTPPPPPPTNRAPVVAIDSPAAGAAYTAPATITVTATASDPDGTVVGVDFYAGSMLIESDPSSSYSATWSGVGAGTHTLTAVARDNAGASTTSATVTVVVAPSTGGGALPAPWTGGDLGSPAMAGSATHSSGTFTITAGGADIWGTSDQFRFVHQPMTGNGEVIARVASLTNPNAWAKAGVMIRSQLTAGSAHAFALVSAANGTAFQRRITAGGASTNTAGPASVAPSWVRLARSGNTFSAYTSSNGTNWTLIGSQSITMGATVYVGLAVTSHNSAALATASLTNVQVIPVP